MPNIKSAEKRRRQSYKRRSQNLYRLKRIRTAEKAFNSAMEQGDQESAREWLTACFSRLDKAAKTNAIAKKKASRKKSRLSTKFNEVSG